MSRKALLMLIGTIMITSCQKDEGYNIEQYVRILNHTDYNIDSIKITSDGTFGIPQYLSFSNIASKSTTEYKYILDMNYENSIQIFLEDTLIIQNWEMPTDGYATQPQGNAAIWPPGSYSFGIFAVDSMVYSVIFSLEDYKKESQ